MPQKIRRSWKIFSIKIEFWNICIYPIMSYIQLYKIHLISDFFINLCINMERYKFICWDSNNIDCSTCKNFLTTRSYINKSYRCRTYSNIFIIKFFINILNIIFSIESIFRSKSHILITKLINFYWKISILLSINCSKSRSYIN